MAESFKIKNDRIEFYEGIAVTAVIFFTPGFNLPEQFAGLIDKNKVQSLIFPAGLDAIQADCNDVLVSTK